MQVSEDGLNFEYPGRFLHLRDAFPRELWGDVVAPGGPEPAPADSDGPARIVVLGGDEPLPAPARGPARPAPRRWPARARWPSPSRAPTRPPPARAPAPRRRARPPPGPAPPPRPSLLPPPDPAPPPRPGPCPSSRIRASPPPSPRAASWRSSRPSGSTTWRRRRTSPGCSPSSSRTAPSRSTSARAAPSTWTRRTPRTRSARFLGGAGWPRAEQLQQAEALAERFGGDLRRGAVRPRAAQPGSAFTQLAQRAQGSCTRPARRVRHLHLRAARSCPPHKAMPLGNRWAVLSDLVRRIPTADLKRRLQPVLRPAHHEVRRARGRQRPAPHPARGARARASSTGCARCAAPQDLPAGRGPRCCGSRSC